MTAFNIVFIFFISMVFIGAFFLMNLTLAVVNTSFTKSQNEAKAAAAPPKPENGEDGEVEVNLDEIEEDIGAKGEEREIGISEFFIAKRAAKKMIEFLRARQTAKAVMNEKAKLAAVAEANLVQDELETPNKAETNRPLYHTQSSTKKPAMGA
jgi:lipopolysaccharide export LptBFGC system permease protein LptF